MFIGATLSATSVGITARVLKDLDKINEKESRIILGAAVIDDVMGLVILAAVSGIIKAADQGEAGISTLSIGFIVLKAVAFLVIAIWIGSKIFSQNVFTHFQASSARNASDNQCLLLLSSGLPGQSH